MKSLGMMLALLLLPISAIGQGIGTLTLLEGSVRVMRGTGILKGGEGMNVRAGDILENADKGIAQLEFVGGTVVVIGPSSRLYIFRHAVGRTGGATAGDSAGTQLVLLSGWLKGESKPDAGSYRYETPFLETTTGNGTVLIHTNDTGVDIFVESGSANIAEVSPDGSARHPGAAKAGQFFSRRAGKPVSTAARPAQAFIDAMPPAFRDTLPSRLARFAGKSVEPKVDHQVSYAEVEAWLTMPATWRRGLIDRFEPRLRDPEFRRQLELHVAEFPEWDVILHPEKKEPGDSSAGGAEFRILAPEDMK